MSIPNIFNKDIKLRSLEFELRFSYSTHINSIIEKCKNYFSDKLRYNISQIYYSNKNRNYITILDKRTIEAVYRITILDNKLKIFVSINEPGKEKIILNELKVVVKSFIDIMKGENSNFSVSDAVFTKGIYSQDKTFNEKHKKGCTLKNEYYSLDIIYQDSAECNFLLISKFLNDDQIKEFDSSVLESINALYCVF